MLPDSILGEAFLDQYSDHSDPVTIIDKKRTYGVRAAARHPIYETFRVKVCNSMLGTFFDGWLGPLNLHRGSYCSIYPCSLEKNVRTNYFSQQIPINKARRKVKFFNLQTCFVFPF